MQPNREFLLNEQDAARLRALSGGASLRRSVAPRRIRTLVVALLVILTLLCLGIAVAAGKDAEYFDGVVDDVAVTLVLPASGAGTLRFGTPRNCTLRVRFEMRSNNTSRYGLHESNGGYCDRLIDGRMTLTTGKHARRRQLKLRTATGEVLAKSIIVLQ